MTTLGQEAGYILWFGSLKRKGTWQFHKILLQLAANIEEYFDK